MKSQVLTRPRPRIVLTQRAMSLYLGAGGTGQPNLTAMSWRLAGILRRGTRVGRALAVRVPVDGFIWVLQPSITGGWVAVDCEPKQRIGDLRAYWESLRREKERVKAVLNELCDRETFDAMVYRLESIEREESRVFRLLKQEARA